MSDTNLATVDVGSSLLQDVDNKYTRQFVTMKVDGQLFGIPVLSVRDILKEQPITHIPLASPEIEGAINLRGRIVTVINMHKRLGMEGNRGASMHVVVDHNDDQYSLIVDEVGEVLSLSLNDFESNPANLTANWQQISTGVFRLQGELLLILNIETLLNL